MEQFEYFSHNGELLPANQAVVPLSSIEYLYGFGVYESVRVSKGVIYFLDDHVERLLKSASLIELAHALTLNSVAQNVKELIDKNKVSTCNIKIVLIGGQTAETAQLYIQCLNPLFPGRQLYKTGTHAITYRYERLFPQAKTLNMLSSYLAFRKAKQADAYDALLINNAGSITEGTRTNFFCIEGNTIVSPPEEEILRGVMRKATLKVAQENNFEIIYRNMPFDELGNYDGAFMTNSSSKIIPIRSIDTHVFGDPPKMLQELMTKLDDFLASCNGSF
jgi:branched-chain amino acid aminotransferase